MTRMTKKWNSRLLFFNLLVIVGIFIQTACGQTLTTKQLTAEFDKEGDRLFTQATGQSKVEVFAESETKFFLKVVDAQLEFVKDESGKVTKVILYQGGQIIEGAKIK